MIRHVSLQNWKAFEQLDLELPEGTSFIVARNGVGKTSLLQALHFGLFGGRRLLASSSDVEHAVRGGDGQAAIVQLTVELNGDEWVIARKVPGNVKARDPLPTPSVAVNGNQTSEEAWRQALKKASGVGLTELRLLSAIGEGGTLSPAEQRGAEQYNLVNHLSDVLGVSRLRQSAVVLRRLAKDASTAADKERLTLRDRPKRSSLGERERLISERQALVATEERLSEELYSIEVRQGLRRSWAEWHARDRTLRNAASSALTDLRTALAEHQEAIERLLDRHVEPPSMLRDDLPGDEAAARVVARQRDTQQLVQDLLTRRDAELRAAGGDEARLASIDAALELLSGASAICPTCRQPLSQETAERARTQHLRERSEVIKSQAAVQSAVSRADAAIADLTRAAGRQLPTAVPPPTEPPPDEDDDEGDTVSQVSTELEASRERIQQIDASLRVLDAESRQRATDADLSRRLVAQYRHADLASVTASAFDIVADSMCRERINPLAQLLAKRWSDLWPGRPSLSLNPETGDIVGEVAETQITLADLSGGERAVAVILLRLLALQSASNSPILLMDEPLEHLDPRNRRLLASLLVAATGGDKDTPPRQLLVTTYEESVTRRLDQQVAGQGSHVVYVAARAQ